MAISKETVRYVANLARLGITPEEEELFSNQLNHILGHVEQINRLNTGGIEPTFHAVTLSNVTRPDTVRPGIDRDEILKLAPKEHDGHYAVPKIIED